MSVRCILPRLLELRARGFSARLLEQTLRAAPNQATGARQIHFYRAARWTPVGDALRKIMLARYYNWSL